MKEFLVETFADHRNLIVFLHVISAVIWVGGMIAIRFATHQSLAMITDPKMRLERAAHTLKRLFTIVWPFVVILIVTAVFMAVGLGFRAAAVDEFGNVIDEYAMSLYNIVHIKEAIWMVMALNLGAMMWRRRKAEIALKAGNLEEAKNMLGLIAQYMVPVNIALGIIAIFIGVVLRNAY
ncbi:MAG: hypothetical protein JXK04_00890 [Campylobacterales bacterium]|nr:hypothetical protein [Campylobacterales bacterium]